MAIWIDMKKLRESRGWRQSETADKLGVSRPYLSAIENHRRGISKYMIEAAMRVFGLKFEDFFQSGNVRCTDPYEQLDKV